MDCTGVFTIKDYLEGKARNITIPEKSLMSICCDADVEPYTEYAEATQKQRDLSLAWLYVWIAGSPTQSGGWNEENADWKQSENGERMSANVLKQYLAMANDIFRKYELPVVGEEPWGFVGRGFRNPRRYR